MSKSFELISKNIHFDADDLSPEQSDPCQCRSKNGTDRICYDEKCLNVAMMMECVTCQTNCCNKRFQQNKFCATEVREAPGKGHGLFAMQDIKKRDLVIEYLGEIVSSKEFQTRMRRANSEKHLYVMQLKPHVFLDARYKGSNSRYINHSCEPNCEILVWTVVDRLRVGFFAIKEIPKGTELTFDYRWKPSLRPPTKCMCGTPSCRGYIELYPKGQSPTSYFEERIQKGKWTSCDASVEYNKKSYPNARALLKENPSWIVGKCIQAWWEGNQEFFVAMVESHTQNFTYHCKYFVDQNESEEDLMDEKSIWNWFDENSLEETTIARTCEDMDVDDEDFGCVVSLPERSSESTEKKSKTDNRYMSNSLSSPSNSNGAEKRVRLVSYIYLLFYSISSNSIYFNVMVLFVASVC